MLVVIFRAALEGSAEITGGFADLDDVDHGRRKKLDALDGAGKLCPVLHIGRDTLELVLQVNVRRGVANELHRLHERNVIVEQRRKRLGELRVETHAQERSENREVQLGAVPPDAPLAFAREVTESEDSGDEHDEDDPPIGAEEFARADQHPRGERQRLSGLTEQGRQLRQEESHENDEQGDARGKNDRRINERAGYPALQVSHHGKELDLAFENLRHRAADLAGFDHIAVELGKTGTGFLERGGKGHSLAQRLARAGGHATQSGFVLPLLDDLQRAVELESGFEQFA